MKIMNNPKQDSVAKPDGPMDDDEIVAYLRGRIDDALNRADGEVSDVRSRLLERYRGEDLGEEEDGRSTFCTREIYELVEEALPSLLSVFFSSKNPVLFEPRSPQDVAASEQESDVVDHYLFRRSNSFLTFHDLFKSALLDPVAYAKVHCIMQEDTVHHRFTDLTAMQMQRLMGTGREWKEGVEIRETVDPATQEPRFDFVGTEIVSSPRLVVDAVPPEEMLVDRAAAHLDLDKVWDEYGMLCHETEVTFSDLVKQGYDASELDETSASTSTVRLNSERTNRFNREDERPYSRTSADYATRTFTVSECYVKMDCDGSGIADGYRIVLIGDKLFSKERISYQPFVAVSGVPMPFKHIGMSPAEGIEDLQKLKTKLVRVLLNNLYDNEEKASFIDRQALTATSREQLRDPAARWIEVKGSPNQAVRPLDTSSIAGDVMASLQYADDLVKRRTGMAPDNALNPDVLRDATAHGMLASMDRQSSRLMHFARILAECCVKKIGVKLHQLLRMYQDKRLTLQLRGQWVDVDPADWSERTEMRVAVGLGFNSKEQRIAALTQLLTLQKEAISQNLCSPKQIKTTLEQMVEESDLGFYGQYFVDPTAPGWKPPQPPPNPQIEALKTQAQIAKMQEDTRIQQVRLQNQSKQAELQSRNAIEQAKIEADRERVRADAELKQMEAKMTGTMLPELKYLEAKKLEAEVDKIRAETQKLGADVAHIGVSVDKTYAETAKLHSEPAAKPDKEETSDEKE